MFKTDDTIIKICMFLAGLIFFLYGTVMMFNYDFMIDRYPTFEDNLTTEFFLNWFGAVILLPMSEFCTWVSKDWTEHSLCMHFQ